MFNDGVENTLCQIASTFPCSLLSASSFLHFFCSKSLPEGGVKNLQDPFLVIRSLLFFSSNNLIRDLSRRGIGLKTKKYPGPRDGRKTNQISSSGLHEPADQLINQPKMIFAFISSCEERGKIMRYSMKLIIQAA